MNAYIWAENFPFGFQTNTLKHHQNCGLRDYAVDFKQIACLLGFS